MRSGSGLGRSGVVRAGKADGAARGVTAVGPCGRMGIKADLGV